MRRHAVWTFLCDYHVDVLEMLKEKDHVGDEDSVRVSIEVARQCPQCRVVRRPL